ncbi:MAG: 7-carboxy-7-deazaguanine synthase QueE [Geobacteraceae bacterium]|nr:7-carboxy-7-deazaguanine synthase QueE [Geobacteraceae bacterium]
MNSSGNTLVEIFSSIQGEGMLIGARQIFIRFHGCQLSCEYCDSRESRSDRPPATCRVEKRPGYGEFVAIANPVTASRIGNILEEWISMRRTAHHSISLTGGEPLLQLASQKEYLHVLKDFLPLYLETNGVDYEALAVCVDSMDYISMDMKLPSATGMREYWKEHAEFLKIAAQRNVFVKIVVSDRTQTNEIQQVCDIISSVDDKIPLILQPLTVPDGRLGISGKYLIKLQETASNNLREVRVIPQTHKFLGLL